MTHHPAHRCARVERVVRLLLGAIVLSACTTGADPEPSRTIVDGGIRGLGFDAWTTSSCDGGADCVAVGVTTEDAGTATILDASPLCGDGILQSFEQCDTSELGGATCGTAVGPSSTGEVKCSATCKLDLSGCSGVDSGVCAPNCGTGRACGANNECASLVCQVGVCRAPSCEDHVVNGNETEQDCGGDCKPCGTGLPCKVPKDCESNVCQLSTCQRASCADAVKNQAETDVDCGGGCAPCLGGFKCTVASDCRAGLCTSGTCEGSGAKSLAAGAYHTCVITALDAVECWGYNGYGELGNGSTIDSREPVAVSSISGRVTALAAGLHHTCALDAQGMVRCWGNNAFGQLGNGTTTDSPVPVAVQGLPSGVIAIAAGTDHTCALSPTAGMQCWGANDSGQLGDGTTVGARTPVTVKGIDPSVSAMAAGWYHTCALSVAGKVQCWGSNAQGQLGSVASGGGHVPVVPDGLDSGVTQVSAGTDYTCAVVAGGGLKCWGDNSDGQLGIDSVNFSATPAGVKGLDSGVMAVEAGWYHTCARLTAGEVRCWGDNTHGQLGIDGVDRSLVPIAVKGLPSAASLLSVGTYHTCASLAAGTVECWGVNTSGQLGDRTTITDSKVPRSVIGL